MGQSLSCSSQVFDIFLLLETTYDLTPESVADPGFSPGGGAPTPKSAIIFQFFAENCMKMKEFGPPGGRASLAPPLDPPMRMLPNF